MAITSGIPIIFGVLTVNNKDQALKRSGSEGKNKGVEVAKAALDIVDTLQNI